MTSEDQYVFEVRYEILVPGLDDKPPGIRYRNVVASNGLQAERKVAVFYDVKLNGEQLVVHGTRNRGPKCPT